MAVALSVGRDGKPWIIDEAGKIYVLGSGMGSDSDSGEDKVYTIDGCGRDIAAGADGSLFTIDCLTSYVQQWTPKGWVKIGEIKASKIAALNEISVAVVDKNNTLWISELDK